MKKVKEYAVKCLRFWFMGLLHLLSITVVISIWGYIEEQRPIFIIVFLASIPVSLLLFWLDEKYRISYEWMRHTYCKNLCFYEWRIRERKAN